MDSFASSPFAALTIIVAPAILTNASSVLSLGTGNRLARVVDRTRVIAVELASADPTSDLAAAHRDNLRRLQVRSQLLLRALRGFYASIGSFAASALISVTGALMAGSTVSPVFQTMAALSLVSGTIGVGGLVVGCSLTVRETQLAVQFLSAEAALLQQHPHGPEATSRRPPPSM
jgi:hypothetical protein